MTTRAAAAFATASVIGAFAAFAAEAHAGLYRNYSAVSCAEHDFDNTNIISGRLYNIGDDFEEVDCPLIQELATGSTVADFNLKDATLAALHSYDGHVYSEVTIQACYETPGGGGCGEHDGSGIPFVGEGGVAVVGGDVWDDVVVIYPYVNVGLPPRGDGGHSWVAGIATYRQ